MDSREIVLKTLKENKVPLKAGEIADKSGLEKKEVEKAMNLLKTAELIVSPKRCFWTAK